MLSSPACKCPHQLTYISARLPSTFSSGLFSFISISSRIISCTELSGPNMMSMMVVFSKCVVVLCCSVRVTHGAKEAINGLSTYNILQEPRKKQQDILSIIIPMLAMPFITQTIILPAILFFMKFTLLKSIFLGKLGIFLWVVNTLRNRLKDNQGGFYTHNVNLVHNDHPGHLIQTRRSDLYDWDNSHKDLHGYDFRRRKRKSVLQQLR